MKNLTPTPREARSPLPAFTPVPRMTPRHDGWTPERQRAFIEALADTGSVPTACRMVNMSTVGAYYLRRAPGAESFRRAWDAALDFGLARLKDEAFERAVNGQLVPVFSKGRLMGFRRVKNDKLLMFLLRHYGQDANGKRTTINYFSTKATAGAAAAVGGAAAAGAEASTTSVRTVISGAGDGASQAQLEDRRAAAINGFAGVALDEEAKAAIEAALIACAERRRATRPEDDPDCCFVGEGEARTPFVGELEMGAEALDFEPFREGELGWEGMGEGGENAEIERVLSEMARRAETGEPDGGAAPA